MGDSICREHLSDKDILKVKELIESHSYLSEDEFRLKEELEVSLRKFYQFYDEYVQNRNKSESDVFDHFQEIRFQIDEQREELNKRIDDIVLATIERTKNTSYKFQVQFVFHSEKFK